MKSIYIVMTGTYNAKPTIATFDYDEAKDLAIAINHEEYDCKDVDKFIISIPLMITSQLFDINDIISTTIISTQKAYEPYLRTFTNSDVEGLDLNDE